MTETTTSATELTSQYKNQVASDLDRNVKEQERVTAELTALQQQLASLQHDHSVLVSVQQALGATPAARPARAGSATTSSRQKKSEARPRRQVKTTPAKQPTGKKAVAKTAGPTLVKLIQQHLADQGEPRSAAEVTTALSKAHPERGIKTSVVRASLENLVARSQAHRTKQGSSVFYTVTSQPESAMPGTKTQAETAG
ncbi:hypothetical protein ACIQMZ_35640 [Streptomyces longwoodensis]|uniref:hypothetical protein n=1 Tax=Streptomyces longwoodensis TaxID=68231 RepID=UPI00380EBFEB